jgi:AAHS family benzoate transporter-like MFS transporter
VFVFSAQVLVYAYVTQAYPADIRATALGLTASVGRLGAIVGPTLTGLLVVAGSAHPWSFYFFAAVACLAALTLTIVPRIDVHSDDPTAAAAPTAAGRAG